MTVFAPKRTSAGRPRPVVSDRAFTIAYQPVISLADGTLHHFEALIRFESQTSPAAAIRLAEALDITMGFDLAVARRVSLGLAADPALVAAVNVSARSLQAAGFVDAFLQVTQHRGRLLVELTESAALGDLRKANHAIQRLRTAGHRVCLDDFGAGQTSLEYVRELEVDFLKIDGRYVRDLADHPRGAAVVRHLAALCRELGVVTIAEMVETAEVDALLHQLGVDLGQGWFYGKPRPEAAWDQA